MSLTNDHITMLKDSKVLTVGAETSREAAKSLEKRLRATGGILTVWEERCLVLP